MYAGRIVEQADVFDLYAQPGHPYTKGLLDSIPRLDQKGETLAAIGGLPPNLAAVPPGCPFNPRCVYADIAVKTALVARKDVRFLCSGCLRREVRLTCRRERRRSRREAC